VHLVAMDAPHCCLDGFFCLCLQKHVVIREQLLLLCT
jgi:hypothetical protein